MLAGLLVYFGVRAATSDDAGPAEAHARSLVHLEQTLGIAREGDLQRLIIDHHALVTLANWVYIWGHWPLIAVSAAWLFRHRPEALPPHAHGDLRLGRDRHDHLPRLSRSLRRA